MAAAFVVSERGESLSPKKEPPITAPATKGKLASNEIATPISTTPMVPTEPQEVPVKVEKNNWE